MCLQNWALLQDHTENMLILLLMTKCISTFFCFFCKSQGLWPIPQIGLTTYHIIIDIFSEKIRLKPFLETPDKYDTFNFSASITWKKEGLVLNFKEVRYSPRIFTFSAPYRKRQTSHNAAKYNIWSIHWFLEFHEWPKHKKGFLEMVKEWNHSKKRKITLKYIFENVNHLKHYSKLFFRKQRQTFWKISKRTKQYKECTSEMFMSTQPRARLCGFFYLYYSLMRLRQWNYFLPWSVDRSVNVITFWHIVVRSW